VADQDREPSMEDILSSIKRIIAEDSDAKLSVPRGRRAVAVPASSGPDTENDILELTDPVAVETPADAASEAKPEPTVQATPEPVVHAKPEPSTQAKPDGAPLVSPTTVEASRSSLAALSALVVKPEVHGVDTLEGLVREMLKPMLAQWLDQRLPEIVERQVAAEIRRIAERG
jgi:uncharacterized protein